MRGAYRRQRLYPCVTWVSGSADIAFVHRAAVATSLCRPPQPILSKIAGSSSALSSWASSRAPPSSTKDCSVWRIATFASSTRASQSLLASRHGLPSKPLVRAAMAGFFAFCIFQKVCLIQTQLYPKNRDTLFGMISPGSKSRPGSRKAHNCNANPGPICWLEFIEEARGYRWIARGLGISKNTVGEIIKRQS